MGKSKRKARETLLRRVQQLDALANSQALDEEGWALRYHLEDQIVNMDGLEEEYWRQRSRLRWDSAGRRMYGLLSRNCQWEETEMYDSSPYHGDRGGV
jgi:hypothetical protein